ncbi:hypothetical protein O181_039318 [Austropuccinia psidii MF-1]|uniref:Uncharacterized protein n=1 Tax=Austropuccinia psidii MF-1 TaxID=1389203 RepID=A0A9Q3DF50_9BASI|nr:hypothetical protein [Austropuccinia psidii MF-1]
MLSEDQKTKLAQGKDNSPVEVSQASTSAKKGKENPKEQSEGKAKDKGKGKAKVEQDPQNYRTPKKEKTARDNVFNMARTLMEFKKQVGGKNEPILCKEIHLLNLLNNFETCNKEILAKLNHSEYMLQKLGREILQVKESQKTIIGLESMNKEEILSLRNICARIESKFILLNQPDENYISCITKQLRELRIWVKNLENSTGHNAALFQEQLEKSDKERI